jgi:hypothetical protein
MAKNNKSKRGRAVKPAPYKSVLSAGGEGSNLLEGNLAAGNKALSLVGDDQLIQEYYRAVCRVCHVYLSAGYRDTADEADADGAPHHSSTGHRIGIEKTYIRYVG